MKQSEEKRKLVKELARLHKVLDVSKLHDSPNHKISKDWLAEVAAILKNLDESDYQEFLRLRKSIIPSTPRITRIKAAQEIDWFIRQKVAEYERYDFSDLDREIGPSNDLARAKGEEIVKLSPELYGIGVNLKALWQKLKSYFKK